MSQVLLDTHVWVWSFNTQQRLSPNAIAALNAASGVAISSISFYEIGQKVRLRKWPEMDSSVASLVDMAHAQGVAVLDVTSEISLWAGVLQWDHRDPFDRIIGATAHRLGFQLLSADTAFDKLNALHNWPGRVW